MLGLTVVVGVMHPLAQVTNIAGQRMMLRLRLHYRVELARAAARLSPSRLAEPEVVTELEASQGATHPMSDVAGKPVQVPGAAITSVVLCAAIWSINRCPAAGARRSGADGPRVHPDRTDGVEGLADGRRA